MITVGTWYDDGWKLPFKKTLNWELDLFRDD